jgi:hypothetical protein
MVGALNRNPARHMARCHWLQGLNYQLPVRQKIRVRFLALPPREVGSRVSRKSSVRQAVCHSEYRGMNPLNTRCNNLQPFTSLRQHVGWFGSFGGIALCTGQWGG